MAALSLQEERRAAERRQRLNDKVKQRVALRQQQVQLGGGGRDESEGAATAQQLTTWSVHVHRPRLLCWAFEVNLSVLSRKRNNNAAIMVQCVCVTC